MNGFVEAANQGNVAELTRLLNAGVSIDGFHSSWVKYMCLSRIDYVIYKLPFHML